MNVLNGKTFAYVCYTRDNVKKIVDARDVKDFQPMNVNDFNPTRTVRVLWRGVRDEILVEDVDGILHKS